MFLVPQKGTLFMRFHFTAYEFRHDLPNKGFEKENLLIKRVFSIVQATVQMRGDELTKFFIFSASNNIFKIISR